MKSNEKYKNNKTITKMEMKNEKKKNPENIKLKMTKQFNKIKSYSNC